LKRGRLDNRILDPSHRFSLLLCKLPLYIFPCEVDEPSDDLCIILDKDSKNAACSKEASDLGDTLALWPVLNLLYLRSVWHPPFITALVAHDGHFWSTNDELLSIERPTMHSHPLKDPIHIEHVLPYEASDSLVLRYCLV
jgi:hypothetical protein